MLPIFEQRKYSTVWHREEKSQMRHLCVHSLSIDFIPFCIFLYELRENETVEKELGYYKDRTQGKGVRQGKVCCGREPYLPPSSSDTEREPYLPPSSSDTEQGTQLSGCSINPDVIKVSPQQEIKIC